MINMKRVVFKYIGSGSGRNVFDMGNGYVIKVAKNSAGIAQNQTEYKISSMDSSKLFAKVIKVSNNFKFIIMEKAYKINNLSYVWDYFDVDNLIDFISIQELREIHMKYNLLWEDLCRGSSWGIINGRAVIIDYGFTRYVREKYYLPM